MQAVRNKKQQRTALEGFFNANQTVYFVKYCYEPNNLQTHWFQTKQSPAFGIKYNILNYLDKNK
jgi:hypothetical protein